MGCLFCQIVSRETPSRIVLETVHALAFRDLHPAAPTHVLVVPKKHIESVASVAEEDAWILGDLVLAARAVAEKEGLTNGFRLVANCGNDAGQSVNHLHVHVLGGRALSWPPG